MKRPKLPKLSSTPKPKTEYLKTGCIRADSQASSAYSHYTVPLSHILWEKVPYQLGKDSQLIGKVFPHFAGINSQNIREYFPTIYGTIGTNAYLQPRKGKGWHLTMRNGLKYYENKLIFEPKQGISYEKYHFKKYFS